MEKGGMFLFPAPDSSNFVEIVEKDLEVRSRVYLNIASVAHSKQIHSSTFHPTVSSNMAAIQIGNDSIIATEQKFYIIEDKYKKRDPPTPTEEDDPESEGIHFYEGNSSIRTAS